MTPITKQKEQLTISSLVKDSRGVQTRQGRRSSVSSQKSCRNTTPKMKLKSPKTSTETCTGTLPSVSVLPDTY